VNPSRPNLIFIVADDLGFADLGCYGGREASFGPVSPILDAMAARGIRFTQGYANSSVCSPTRFAMITARWQYRLRGAAEEPIAGAARNSGTLGLPPEHPTLPSLLRDAGYRTALVGKWHLGYPPHFGPLSSGYDEHFGPMGGAVDYFSHRDSRGNDDLWEGQTRIQRDEYLTDALSARAVQTIERWAAEAPERGHPPFMMSLHYTAPHWPWETREDRAVVEGTKNNLFHLDGGNIETYRRMIHHMDEGIGQVLHALERTGQRDNTLVVFTSDNGGERFSDNWPLVGGKMDLTEGGIRVPYIAQWPAVIPAGSTTAQHCLTMDWSATFLAAAGVEGHPDYPLDGVSLLPVLRNPNACFERPLFWRMKHRMQRAHRAGPWKYLKVDEHEYLFDLSADERERANLARRDPERLAAMRQAWEHWEASVPPIPEDAAVHLGFGLADMPSR
jgi:arylsulfatase A-like enzyme